MRRLLSSGGDRVLTMETLTSVVADPLRGAPFMHEVIPELMSRMARNLEEDAPESLRRLPAISVLKDWYNESADSIRVLQPPPMSEWRSRPSRTFVEREALFGSVLDEIRDKGQRVRESLVAATTSSRWDSGSRDAHEIDTFLENFYARRLTLRLLIGHYSACRRSRQRMQEHEGGSMDEFLRSRDAASESSKSLSCYLASTFDELDLNKDGFLDSDELARARTLYQKSDYGTIAKHSVVGLVDKEMSPFDVAVQAIADVQAECKMSEYRTSPPFMMYGRGKGETLPYLPRHLYKILRDVLRNAAKATLDNCAPGVPVKVVISDAEGQNDVVFKVADEAGGIPRSKVRSIFKFSNKVQTDTEITSVLADQAQCRALGKIHETPHRVIGTRRIGGHGLPISKLYAKYFHGDLRIRSMQGYGTDAYIYISRVKDDYVLPT